MLSVSKPMSLVEQKKQQWAREREEMSKCFVPWGPPNQQCQHPYNNRLPIRNQFASTLELHKQSSYEYLDNEPRQRSPSLPPIVRQKVHQLKEINEKGSGRKAREVIDRNITGDKGSPQYEEDGEGDTSGYGSETFNNFNNINSGYNEQQFRRNNEEKPSQNPIAAWQNRPSDQRSQATSVRSTPPGGESWSPLPQPSGEEGRPRWGDRGVATGRLWEPQDPSARLPQMQIQKKGTPSWVERGLNMLDNTTNMLIIDQQSSHSGGGDGDHSSYAGSEAGKNTYLRGQNVPIEPDIKAQRENRRLKALEIQSVILSQLEERERQKKEERENRIKEEREEELRIQRQQQEDVRRLEEERRRHEEKRETERRRIETLKKALEDAEVKAKQDRENKKNSHRNKLNEISNDDLYSYSNNIRTDNIEKYTKESNVSEENGSIKTPRHSKQFMKPNFDINEPVSSHYVENSSNRTSQLNTPRSIQTDNVKMFIPGIQPINLFQEGPVSLVPISLPNDLISPSNLSPSSMQFAVLLPQVNNSLYSLTQPLSLQSCNSGILLHTDERLPEKLLTPRKYRNAKSRDACTQTETVLYNQIHKINDKNKENDKTKHRVDKDYQSIDENAPLDNQNTSNKRDRRYRSEERYKKEIDNRPKWGVNRPAAQYKKQSEKDPFYSQKRKVRQRHRQSSKQYMSHSSEDSRSPSPPTQLENMLDKEPKHRITFSQTHWRNKSLKEMNTFKPSNINVETVNIKALECDTSGYVHIGDDINENRGIEMHESSILPTKRFTLSQKFINDKYGNRKLWHEELNNERGKNNTLTYNIDSIYVKQTRKKYIERLDTVKRESDIMEDHFI